MNNNNDTKIQDQIELFSKMAFEGSKDYSQFLRIISMVGVNSVFDCTLFFETENKTKIIPFHEKKTMFLLVALLYRNENLIRFLLEHGADPNARDEDGKPAIWDLQYEDEDPEYGLRIAIFLLDYGADPNILWEDETFFNWIEYKPADLISSMEQLKYLEALGDLLIKYGGKDSRLEDEIDE